MNYDQWKSTDLDDPIREAGRRGPVMSGSKIVDLTAAFKREQLVEDNRRQFARLGRGYGVDPGITAKLTALADAVERAEEALADAQRAINADAPAEGRMVVHGLPTARYEVEVIRRRQAEYIQSGEPERLRAMDAEPDEVPHG